jgi:hypothetical protein
VLGGGWDSVITSWFLIRDDQRAIDQADHRDHHVFMITEEWGAWFGLAAGESLVAAPESVLQY